MAKRIGFVALLLAAALWLALTLLVERVLHLTLDLLAQVVQLIGSEAHGVLVVADDLFGCLLDRVAQLGDVFCQITLNVTGLLRQVVPH